ncbi:glycosyltransferase family 2 protein [Candidatus Parcubacteria bacterium]|nr:MAG: glycosyltransferase family 2 protein [Candidatus Parcubacteria bacterium]
MNLKSGKISVVINTLNEAVLAEQAIRSVSWADEVVICDMHSDDNIKVVAKKLGARVIEHERLDFVEPARNLAIAETTGEWVLVLDPDEEVSDELGVKLKEITEDNKISFVEVPRKNIIFGKWMIASFWWPDYNIRFFKKGKVVWSNEIHRRPQTLGEGIKLPDEERYALIHHHYKSISQFINRMDRYTSVQARELVKNGYRFRWSDVVEKPLNEFLGRFFANQGFKDGLHGLTLSLLQAFSFLIVYLKVWEEKRFKEENLDFKDIVMIGKSAGKDIDYWYKYGNLSKNPLKRLVERVKNKIL